MKTHGDPTLGAFVAWQQQNAVHPFTVGETKNSNILMISDDRLLTDRGHWEEVQEQISIIRNVHVFLGSLITLQHQPSFSITHWLILWQRRIFIKTSLFHQVLRVYLKVCLVQSWKKTWNFLKVSIPCFLIIQNVAHILETSSIYWLWQWCCTVLSGTPPPPWWLRSTTSFCHRREDALC